MKIIKFTIIFFSIAVISYANFIFATEFTGTISTGLNAGVNEQLTGNVIIPVKSSSGHAYFVQPISKNSITTPTTELKAETVTKISVFKFSKTLKKGTTSDDIKELQERLRKEGFFKITPSIRYFGVGTFNAVKAYQKAHKLPSTGLVGPLTILELNKN